MLQPSTSSLGHGPVNVYINYSHPLEAAACIAAIDGSVSAEGHKLKAIWGTTRYCPAYLRGVKCTTESCMQAHEPGEEVESYNHPGSSSGGSTVRGELATQQAAKESGTDRGEIRHLKHAWKEQAKDTAPALPATASWASKPSTSASSTQMQSSSSGSANNPPPSSLPSTTSHNHSSSISSRLPKTQNHPLPPRPPSRNATNEASKQKSQYWKPSITAEPLQGLPNTAPEPQALPTTAGTQKETESGSNAYDREHDSKTSSASSALSSAVDSTVIGPPTPPVSEPSKRRYGQSATSLASTSALPPGLSIPVGQDLNRPPTPVSDFDRTLDTFGDGHGFAFNLAAANGTADSGRGKGLERVSQLVVGDGTPGSSRSASPDFGPSVGFAAQKIDHSGGGDKDTLAFSFDRMALGLGAGQDVDEQQQRYLGHFNPFSTPRGEYANEIDGSESASGTVSTSASPAPTVPPGLSRGHSRDGSAASATGAPYSQGIAKPAGLQALDDGSSAAGRHRSRFGFARQGSGSLALGGGLTPVGSGGSGISIPHSESFRGVVSSTMHGAPASASSSLGMGTSLNGRHSPVRPASATSSASGSLGFALPPGVFTPASSSVNGPSTAFSSPLPAVLPSASSDLPLPPADPSKPSNGAKASLSDLFPGVNLAASFSSSSSLPPALVKSLGISLETLDVTATSAANGKLPNFAPVALGHGGSIASQPLPPPPMSSSSANSGGHHAASSSSDGHTVLSPNMNGGHPLGFGASRQVQQAHAQHAQQAHQAHLAAQQAQREHREREAQLQQNQQNHHGRSPSAAGGGGSSKGQQQPEMYGFMGVQSPPLPGTPGGFGGA